MAKYSYHRVDNNAEDCYEFLEAHGVAVQRTPGGPLDAIVAANGSQAIVEVKDGKKKLRDSQVRFLRDWPGLTAVLRAEADCLELIQKLRGKVGK